MKTSLDSVISPNPLKGFSNWNEFTGQHKLRMSRMHCVFLEKWQSSRFLSSREYFRSLMLCEINECMQVTGSLPCIPYADAAVIFKVICALSHALHIISVAMICQPYVYPMHHAYVCTGLLLFTAVYTYIWKREATAFACLTDHIKKKMLYLTPADIYLRSLRPLQVDAVFYVLKGSVKWNGLVIVTYHFAA